MENPNQEFPPCEGGQCVEVEFIGQDVIVHLTAFPDDRVTMTRAAWDAKVREARSTNELNFSDWFGDEFAGLAHEDEVASFQQRVLNGDPAVVG